MPTTVEEVEKLSWGQLLYLAGQHADESWAAAPQPRPPRRCRAPTTTCGIDPSLHPRQDV